MATLTATYPDALQPVFTEALARYGATVVDDLVTTWLQDRERAMADADIVEARAGRASPQTKARLRVQLGL